MSLAEKVARRVLAREVRILVDRDATLALRAPHRECVVGTFDVSFGLYRILDGEELRRIVKTGRITGGTYSVPLERKYGASWGTDVSEVIAWGNGQRGRRLGEDLFLAKIDALDKQFFHLHGESISVDPEGPEQQPATFPLDRCNTGLGCSVIAATDEATFYSVNTAGQMTLMAQADVQAYLAQKPEAPIELRRVSPVYYSGSIHGVDVQVFQWQERDAYRDTWQVTLRDDDDVILRGAPSFDAAVKKIAPVIKSGRYGKHYVVDLLPKKTKELWERRNKFDEGARRWSSADSSGMAERVMRRYAAYFSRGDVVLMGKYKNHRGKILGFSKDHWGNPTVIIEPIPKGRKQNKVIGLFKIWRADVKENALKQQADDAAEAEKSP